jgi:hypothetical protein
MLPPTRGVHRQFINARDFMGEGRSDLFLVDFMVFRGLAEVGVGNFTILG